MGPTLRCYTPPYCELYVHQGIIVQKCVLPNLTAGGIKLSHFFKNNFD